MAAAHPQGPYLTRYSRHRTIPAAAYSRSFRARGQYIYIRIYINPPRPRLLTDLCQTGLGRRGRDKGTWIRFMGPSADLLHRRPVAFACSFSIIASPSLSIPTMRLPLPSQTTIVHTVYIYTEWSICRETGVILSTRTYDDVGRGVSGKKEWWREENL